MKQVIHNKLKIESNPLLPFDTMFLIFTIISITFKFICFQYKVHITVKPFFSEINMYMILSSFASVLIVISILIFIFNKKSNVSLIIINGLAAVLLMSDTIYFKYYNTVISVPLFYSIPNLSISIHGERLQNSIIRLITINDIIYFLWDFPLLIIGLYLFNKKKCVAKKTFKKRFTLFFVMVIISYFCFQTTYIRTDITPFKNSDNIIKNQGLLYYHYYDLKKFLYDKIFAGKDFTKKEKALFKSFFMNKKNEGIKYKGKGKGKNLIIVQVEALQEFVVNRNIKGREITPNLNRLIKDSIYFNNIYYQISDGSTSDAELMCYTSLYPLIKGSVFQMYSKNNYYSLAKELKSQGYDTYAMHAFLKQFWNRQVMYKSLGFDTFYSIEDYKKDEIIGWSLSDASFFRQSMDKINYKNPFYANIVTISSHYPFKSFEGFEFDVGEYEGNFIGNYIKAANYVDNCIGLLIDDLKKRGIYDNTLLVIYGDHHAISNNYAETLLEYIGKKYSQLEWGKLQKVPLIIHYPGQKTGELVETTGGQIDILPTIANLMDFKVPYAMGKDLINTKRGYAAFVNGSFVTDNYFYFNNTERAYNLNTGELISKDKYLEDKEELQIEILLSELIHRKNALKNR